MKPATAAKFLFVASNEWPNPAGSELLWSSAAEKLARRGIESKVSVWYWDKPPSYIGRLRSAGCQVFYRRPPSFFNRFGRKLFSLPGYARRHLRSTGSGADLVVISQGNNMDGLSWMEAARAERCKYAVIAQCAAEAWYPNDDMAERLAACYDSASRAYFVSQANLDLSRRQFVTPLREGRVIRNPFNVRYDARPAWPPDPSKQLTLACVGRLDAVAKGQDMLLEVLSLPHWRDRKVRVSLVGKGVNERGLRRMVDELKLTGVEFSGYSNNIESVWRRHHALVLPSRYEGMPLAVVEAMLCGRPCIVTDVGGNRELVQEGINGFLAKAPTVELLDEAMGRAWESRGRLREMGERAASDVRQWVSADPAEDFVRELLTLAEHK